VPPIPNDGLNPSRILAMLLLPSAASYSNY
jgi:hypothetical protein